MTKTFAAALVALCLVPPAFAHDGHDHGEHEDHKASHIAEVGDLRLIHGWAIEDADPLLIFVEIQNVGEETRILESVNADWARLDLVAPLLKDGQTQLAAMPSLPIPPGSKMQLAPGAVAIRAMNVAEDLHQGDVAHVDLHFSGGLEAEIDVEIMPAGTTRHPHAGHNH